MTQKHCLLSFLGFHHRISLAQESPTDSLPPSPWKISGAANASFSNVGLSNWAGGGDDAISLGLLLDGKALRETEQSIWESYLNAAFGLARVGGNEALFKKTDDQLILGTRYGYKFSPRWSVTGGLEFRSQFAPGFSYALDANGREFEALRLSEFLSPGYFNVSTGLQYKDKYFNLNFSPAMGKFTIVLEDSLANAGAFGVAPGNNVRAELGANFNLVFEISPLENVSFKSVFNLFANYETLGRMDVNWETLLVFKVNKFITTSFGTQLIYDHDILIEQADGQFQQATQFKHVLNLNIGYKFAF
ncbi:MAG: DUF3078 domain-containing protein [Microscillaceae bacterium]|nr:DUF3078 domain-containing protein [Microscillaceae bacterium]